MPVQARPRFDRHRNQWTLYHHGRRHYLCSGVGNEPLAWQRAEKFRAMPAGERIPVTVTQLADLWLRRRGTTWHEWILAPLLAYGEGFLLAMLHPDYLDDYMRHLEQHGYERRPAKATPRRKPRRRSYAPSSIRRNVSYAHSVLKWGATRGWVDLVPKLPDLPRVPCVDRSVSPADLAKLFTMLPKRAAEILTFVALTGCRPEEACLLQWSEIDGDTCELRRGKTFRKTGQPRVLYLNAAAHELIDRQPAGGDYVFRNRLHRPYTPGGLRSIIRRAGEAAGVTITGAYQLRHSFAQHALASMTLDEVGRILGHAPGSRITHVYARIRADRALRAVQSLEPVISLDRPAATGADSQAAPRKHRRRAARPTGENAKGRGRRVG